MSVVILETPFQVIRVDHVKRFVLVKRTSKAYPSMAELHETNQSRLRLLSEFRGKHYIMMLDARDGPLRNDPAFETAAREARAEMFNLFDRVAIVVKSAIGALQMRRLQSEASIKTDHVRTFENDEAVAKEYLKV